MKRTRSWVAFLLVSAALLGALWYVPALSNRIAYGIAVGRTEALRSRIGELAKADNLSPLFQAVAAAVKPAVVVVEVRQRVIVDPAPEEELDGAPHDFLGNDPPGGRLLGLKPRPDDAVELAYGLGSGIVVDAEKGYVLTNRHVVKNALRIQVLLADGRKLRAQWVRGDPFTDLAVIKIEANRLIAAPFGDSDHVNVGDWVLAIGAPEGLKETVTAGIVSAKGRVARRGNGYESFIQTDTAINRGNSGGPLVNMRGEVIGVTSAIVSRDGANEGIGLAIPSNMARFVMDQLVSEGRVVRGYLGVRIQNADARLADSFAFPSHEGALVSQVIDGSPAYAAGIMVGDLIVEVDGQTVENANALRILVAELPPGELIDFTLYRGENEHTIAALIEAQPQTEDDEVTPAAARLPESNSLGFSVSRLTAEQLDALGHPISMRGVMIMDVAPGSLAAEQGLREGMIILQAQGHDVVTPEELQDLITESRDGVRLLVMELDGGYSFLYLPKRP